MVSGVDPAAVLFGATRGAILGLVFTRPDESFYFREIVRRTGRGVGAVQRELAQLTACGILRRERDRYYRANPGSPIFEPLKQIVVRTVGLGQGLREALAPVADEVAVAFVFGSFARGEQGVSSDVDVMVVTREEGLTLKRVSSLLGEEQARLGRELNPFVMSRKELRTKWEAGNPFVRRVLDAEKVFLIGDADELKRVAEERVGEGAPDEPRRDRQPARARRPRPQGRAGEGTER